MNYLSKDKIYFLDANVIYYYCNCENTKSIDCERLKNDLKRIQNKVIPSCSINEILIHFSNDINELRRIFSILMNDNFLIGSSQLDKSDNLFSILMNRNNGKELKKLLNSKIYNESRFMFIIAYDTFLLLFFTLLNKFEIEIFNDFYFFIEIYFNGRQFDEINEIKQILKRNYKDADKKAKEIFDDLVFKYTNYLKEFLEFILKKEEINKNYEKYIDLFIELNQNLKNKQKFLKYFNKSCHKHSNEIISDIHDFQIYYKNHNLTLYQSNFLANKIQKISLENSRFHKNDIYDLLYTFSFSPESLKSFNKYKNSNYNLDDIILLTFDDGTIKIIKEFSPESERIINLYKIKVNNLKLLKEEL